MRYKLNIFSALLGILLVICTLLLACNQDSIFADISYEVAPKDPRIKGTPIPPVILENTYSSAASSDTRGVIFTGSYNSSLIHAYRNGLWTIMPVPPGGAVYGLASVDTGGKHYLYALVDSNGLYRVDLTGADLSAWPNWWPSGTSWEWVNVGAAAGWWLQTIYSAGDRVFLGARNGSTYGVFYLDDNKVVQALAAIPYVPGSLLMGAVAYSSAYYLGTAGNGIWKVDFSSSSPSVSQETGTGGFYVMGMKRVGTSIVAALRNGYLYSRPDSGTWSMMGSIGLELTGSLALWTDDWTGYSDKSTFKYKLLLVGVVGSDSSENHGYREIPLDASGNFSSFGFYSPGRGVPTSVANYAEYDASMGTHPVVSCVQVPPTVETPFQSSSSGAVIFAGTPKNGLWSYRNKEWNAEE